MDAHVYVYRAPNLMDGRFSRCRFKLYRLIDLIALSSEHPYPLLYIASWGKRRIILSFIHHPAISIVSLSPLYMYGYWASSE